MNHIAPMGEYERSLVERRKLARKGLGVPESRGHVRVVLDVPAVEPEPPAPPVEPTPAPPPVVYPRHERRVIGYSSAWRLILNAVCAEHKVHPRLVLGTSHDQRAVAARHEAMWKIYQLTRLSLSQIGARFGRHHTTVLHAVRKFEVAA